MRPTRSTDGTRRGAANRWSPRRRHRMAAAPRDAGATSMAIEQMSPLQRLRYASDYFFTLAERERKKGNRGDVAATVALMQLGAMYAAKAAPYQHPKVAATPFKARQPQPAEHEVDLTKLTLDELYTLERLVNKAEKTPPDDGLPSIPSDDYLPSKKDSG
jgi:hypothetical protein